MILTIDNDGPLIRATNYWGGDYDRAGVLYLSINAGAFRLLLPSGWEREAIEMRTAKLAIVSRGPWPREKKTDALEVLLDDGSADPYAIHLGVEQCDRLPTDADAAGAWIFSVWTRPRGVEPKPHQALERPARYRRVATLPCLAPWK